MFECQYESVRYLFLIFTLNIHKTGANDEYIGKIKKTTETIDSFHMAYGHKIKE